jgi:hypothetical protein
MPAIASIAQTAFRRPVARAALLVAGVAAQAGAIAVLGPWTLALWLLPDVALLAGISREAGGAGRLAPRAVPLYNGLHALPGPVALVGLGALVGPLCLGLGLVWLSHVLVDRAAGYGLRAADGTQRG